MEEYLKQLEVGLAIDRDQFLDRYTSIRSELSEQLRVIEYLHLAKSSLPQVPNLEQTDGSDGIDAGTILGDFELIRPIGRGGMAVVYEARQVSLQRSVAVKVLPFAALLDERQIRRFQNESRAVAALDHPNVVAVYSVGQDRGIHFFAMQLVVGQSLADLIATKRSQMAPPSSPQDFQFAAEVGLQACSALHHAHEEGVIHRDVKPSNLLINNQGHVWLSDFGLAHFEDTESVTRTGDVMGTLDYMSPEHLLKSSSDARSDVYSLGATLYELVSLRKPFTAKGHRERSNQAAPNLQEANRRTPVDLATIVTKSMAPEPADRYASAAELGDDLERFKDGKPILARRPTLVDRGARLVRKHARLTALFATLACATIVLLGFATILVLHSRQEATAALAKSTDRGKRVANLLYVRDVQSAYQAWNRKHDSQARAILDAYATSDTGSDPRGFEWDVLNSLVGSHHETLIGRHDGATNKIAVFPDGKRVASVGDDATLRIWDLSSSKLLSNFTVETDKRIGEPLTSLAISPNGKMVAAGGLVVQLWDVESGNYVRDLTRFESNTASLAFSPFEEELAAASRYDRIRILTPKGDVLKEMKDSSRHETLEYSSDGKYLLSSFQKDRKSPRFIRASNVDRSADNVDYKHPTRDFALAAAARDSSFHLVADEYRGDLFLFDSKNGREILSLQLEHGRISDVAISPSSERIAAAFADGGVVCWQVLKNASGKIKEVHRLQRFQMHEGKTRSVRFVSNLQIVSCGIDGAVRSATLPDEANPRLSTFASVGQIESFGSSAAAIIDFESVYLIDANQSAAASKLRRVGKGRQLSISPDRRTVAVQSDVNELELRRLPSYELIRETKTDFEIQAINFSPTGSEIAAVGEDASRTGCYAVLSGNNLDCVAQGAVPGYRESAFRGVAVSPDGRFLVCGGVDDFIAIVNWSSPTDLLNIPILSELNSVDFSPSLKQFLTTHADGVIRIWSWPNPELVGSLVGHQGEVRDAVYSRDGSTIVSSGADRTVRIWSANKFIEFGILFQREAKSGYGMAFSDDGRRLWVGFGGREQASLARFDFDCVKGRNQ